jgi:hypothetical protein
VGFTLQKVSAGFSDTIDSATDGISGQISHFQQAAGYMMCDGCVEHPKLEFKRAGDSDRVLERDQLQNTKNRHRFLLIP